MASFNSVVLQVAVVILVICLALVGLAIWQSVYGDGVKWPPVDIVCPDFWVTTETSCSNNLKLGTSDPSLNKGNCDYFNIDQFNNDCDKRNYARKCGITWDGITDNVALQNKCNKKNN